MRYTLTVKNDEGEVIKEDSFDFLVIIGARDPAEDDMSEDGATEVYELLVFSGGDPIVDVAAVGLLEWAKKQVEGQWEGDKWTQF